MQSRRKWLVSGPKGKCWKRGECREFEDDVAQDIAQIGEKEARQKSGGGGEQQDFL
jgi:hypothetical protein